jgi:hypothetical protein
MRKLILILVCIGLLSLPMSAMAATSAEKQDAIDAGLAYLAATQNASGYWNTSGYPYADTAAALLAFVEQSYKPLGWNGHPEYATVVTNATNYLLSNASTLPFAAGGNWWGFGAGSSGIQWAQGGEDTYITGLAIPALSRLVSNPYGGSPLVNPGTTITTGNATTNGLTYAQVIQKAVDSFTYYQTGPGSNRYGGWRYNSASNDSDMSTTQWAPISFLFADQVPGVTVADGTTKTALRAWLTVVQYASGGVDYQPNAGIVNATHAGGFLLSNYWAGGGGLGGNGAAQALAWLNNDWLEGPNGTWYGNEGNPYAMWAIYKALETIYGTTGAGPISNLHPQGANLIDPGATWNWWEDYCQFLVDTQLGNGSWSGYAYWGGALEAAWYINILNATRTGGGGEVPEPATMILLGSGLVGLAGYARRRMKK